MSIINRKFNVLLIFCAEIFLLFFACSGQEIETSIKISPPDKVLVEGKILNEHSAAAGKNWSFARSIGNIEISGARISDLHLSDRENRAVSFKKLIDGEYLAETKADSWNYRVNLEVLPNEKALAHTSWLKGEQGILMLDDLLPQFEGNNQPISAKVKFELPPKWKILSSEKKLGENIFEVKNIAKAVFLIGKNWRENEIIVGNANLSLAISGEWNFSDAEFSQMAGEIFEEYRKLFGEFPSDAAQIALAHFPREIKFGRWEAETRGANSIIVSSDMPFKTLSLQRLHEQLRHELFHFWIPNGLALTGNYDWFYEGFTVYKSLKTGVLTNQIRFEDFLDTLSQAYNIDNFQEQKLSLLDSSKNRWNGANSQVYSRGMVIAFLCDVALLRESRGKRAVDDIFRQIFKNHRSPNKPQDGNAAVLSVLDNYAELQPIIEKYIKGAGKINWQTDLGSVGIEASETNFNTKLSVKPKLNGRQKDLLNELGYNNWRKISGK